MGKTFMSLLSKAIRTTTPFLRSTQPLRTRTLTTTRILNMSRVAGTESFVLNHTMLRIKDPKASLKFYTEILGMELIRKSDGGDFTNYFLAFPNPSTANLSQEEKAASIPSQAGVLELCHNWGTEKEE